MSRTHLYSGATGQLDLRSEFLLWVHTHTHNTTTHDHHMGRATDLFQKEPPTPSGNVAVEFNSKKVDITLDANVCQRF